jgi:hypothetical protein
MISVWLACPELSIFTGELDIFIVKFAQYLFVDTAEQDIWYMGFHFLLFGTQKVRRASSNNYFLGY